MTTLAARVASEFEALVSPGARCLVAVSGGPDSLALLDLLHLTSERHRRTLIVGHVDHGISTESAVVAERVAEAARGRGLPLRCVRLGLGERASESRARVARRTALLTMAADVGAEVVVVGHHADDQAETVLLRLLRGSGPAGLAGMAARAGVWVRPLLTMSRRELAEHLAARGIEAWNDPSNVDPRHLRSWLRTAVLPMLGATLADVTPRLLRAGRQAAAARAAWDQLPELLAPLEVRTDSGAISVAAPPLWGYRSVLRHAVLAALGRRFGVPLGERRLAAIDRLAESGRGEVRLAATLEAELFNDRLTLRYPVGEPSAAMPLVVGVPARTGLAEITAREAVGGVASRSGWETDLVLGQYFVREWRRGDRIRPLAGRGSRAVSVLLREARVPVSRRREWPVVTDEAGTTIVWVPGICRAGASLPEPGTKALHVECAFA